MQLHQMKTSILEISPDALRDLIRTTRLDRDSYVYPKKSSAKSKKGKQSTAKAKRRTGKGVLRKKRLSGKKLDDIKQMNAQEISKLLNILEGNSK